ncbi:conserved hypothetical protein [Candidatus Desulfarcum epimagneticum]|uniref:Phenolphthiocerol/phthiocerol polyketide synthase subunit E n=1 Tax=uncultured Desulfobacteraceae bacterium TaxID=218296 RepID=A0A484HHS2_9BACT|nr:conserved hypothetical protein [uncultured Desulfobacteraceae bacterium]
MTEEERGDSQEAIAIVGMSGRFPGAENLDEFWQNLKNGVESITFFNDEDALAAGTDPKLLKNPKFVKAHGVLENIEMFDADFFDMTPRDATFLDPQHRLFLECAWEALENAGYNSETYPGRIGVFAGTSFSTYLLRNILPNKLVDFPTSDRLDMALTNHKDTMPMRVSFHMNLTGPSISLGTTCSTSLVAVHLAAQSLLTYQSDMAITGSSFLRVPPKEGYLYQEGMIYSPDGHIRTFDADSKGIVTGAGVGAVVMKRVDDAISDRDYIHAVIKGTAVNNDGSTKIGYTAPSISGQAEAISEAILMAGIDSSAITYIEAHGTGTELGDPVEVRALVKAFSRASVNGEKKKHFCGIGSVKSNIGHLNHAAGMAGLLKTVLALKHQSLPPTLNFRKPNPDIDFDNSPFYVNTTHKKWDTQGSPRRAGVNAFGIGGTNAHVVLEEAPTQKPSKETRPYKLITLSAKTDAALSALTDNLAGHLEKHPDANFADVAYTLQVGRRTFKHRQFLVCKDSADATAKIRSQNFGQTRAELNKSANQGVALMFPGQGAQHINMGSELYETEPVFREQIDICAKILAPQMDLDLRDILYPRKKEAREAARRLEQTAITQPALFVIEHALARLLMSWGIHPEAMIGHSIGEYVAACLAEVLSLEDALMLVAERGRMIQKLPGGAMLAVALSPEESAPFINEKLSMAVINGQSQCVISGRAEDVKNLRDSLKKKRIVCHLLSVSHAFHSDMMDPIINPFAERVEKTTLNPPRIPYLSNVTGAWITAEEATDPRYWSTHLRSTVCFDKGLGLLLRDDKRILLEAGPGRTLSVLARRHPDKQPDQIVMASMRHPSEKTQPDSAFLLTSLGKLWSAGVDIDWPKFHAHEERYRLPLPTYPFQKRRYWIDQPKPGHAEKKRTSLTPFAVPGDTEQKEKTNILSAKPPRNANEQKIAEIWENVLGVRQPGIHDEFFELGGDSLSASKLVAKLCQSFKINLSVKTFLSAPTIAESAKWITKSLENIPDEKQESLPSLVRLKKGSCPEKNVFLVHPIDGYVYLYKDLARHLHSEHDVYGFQSPYLEKETNAFVTIEDMAAYYIEIMKTHQPEGPYILGGFSFGGVIAFEMARRLRRSGQMPKLLFMIDTPAPGEIVFDLRDDLRILIFIMKYLFGLDIIKEALALDKLQKLDFEEQISHILKHAKNSERLDGAFGTPELRRILSVIKFNMKAMRKYSPAVYPGSFIYFRAKEPWEKGALLHPESFWVQHADKDVEIITVPGNHITMNQAPNMTKMVNKINKALN